MTDTRRQRRHRISTRRVAPAAAVFCAVTACEGAFTSRVDVAATAAGAELPVTLLAQVIAEHPQLPLRRDVAEGIALLWIDFTLFANQLVAGDSLLDSLTVLAATWPDVQQTIASAYHARLFGDSVTLDSARVDSLYADGELRIVQHVLFRTADTSAPNLQAMKRAQAEVVLGQLRRGDITWTQAVEVTDDQRRQSDDGSLGVIGRGDMAPAFEAAAYGLAPREISNVIRTSSGFHIVRRPELAEVREAFRTGVGERLQHGADSLYLQALEEEWNIEVRSGAVSAVREMAMDPLRAKRSGKVIGSFRGGEFRIRDLARWLQGMDPQIRQGMVMGTDRQIEDMVRTLIRNEVLMREAREADIRLGPDDFSALRDRLRRRIALVRGHMEMADDTIASVRQLPEPARQDWVQTRVTSHLHMLARENQTVRTVPPYLADHLREQARWDIVPAGIERALARARDLRTQLDSVRATQPPRYAPTAPAMPGQPVSPPEGGTEGT